jgi:L-ribulose-5-phosphate 3-epimerase
MSLIGFIQGRLSPMVNNKIQSFPWEHWKNEFSIAFNNKLKIMEWTLDYENLYNNPLMTNDGQNEIIQLCNKNKIDIPSLTGDCFMHMPYFKFDGFKKDDLIEDFKNIIKSSHKINIKIIVVPLVDNGSIENQNQESKFLEGLDCIKPLLKELNIRIAFESDYEPKKLNELISVLPHTYFGINYDTGNSASLNYDIKEEFGLYGDRIINVHIKDRLVNGPTVPLGQGDTDFAEIFKQLKLINYDGNLILQTARAEKNNDERVLNEYRKFVISFLDK